MADAIHRLAEPDPQGTIQVTVHHGQAAKDEIGGAAEPGFLWIAHIERSYSITEIAGRRMQRQYLLQPRRKPQRKRWWRWRRDRSKLVPVILDAEAMVILNRSIENRFLHARVRIEWQLP